MLYVFLLILFILFILEGLFVRTPARSLKTSALIKVQYNTPNLKPRNTMPIKHNKAYSGPVLVIGHRTPTNQNFCTLSPTIRTIHMYTKRSRPIHNILTYPPSKLLVNLTSHLTSSDSAQPPYKPCFVINIRALKS